jgi:hypothetical protein
MSGGLKLPPAMSHEDKAEAGCLLAVPLVTGFLALVLLFVALAAKAKRDARAFEAVETKEGGR